MGRFGCVAGAQMPICGQRRDSASSGLADQGPLDVPRINDRHYRQLLVSAAERQDVRRPTPPGRRRRYMRVEPVTAEDGDADGAVPPWEGADGELGAG
jgi:hypothetical protein